MPIFNPPVPPLGAPPPVGIAPGGMPFEGGPVPGSPMKPPLALPPLPGTIQDLLEMRRNGGMARFPMSGRFSRYSQR